MAIHDIAPEMNSRELHQKGNVVNGGKHDTVDNRETKRFLRRSSLHLKRDLKEIGKEQHRALSKIDRDLQEAKFALKALWIEKHKTKTSGTLLQRRSKSTIQRNQKELFTPPVLGSGRLQRNPLRNEVRRSSCFQLDPDQPLREARSTPSEDRAPSLRKSEQREVGDGAEVGDSDAMEQQQLIPSLAEQHSNHETESVYEKRNESEGGIEELTDNEDSTVDTGSPRDSSHLQTDINDNIFPFGDSVEEEDNVPDDVSCADHSGDASTGEEKDDGTGNNGEDLTSRISLDLEELRKPKPRKLLSRRRSSPTVLYPRALLLGSVCEEDNQASLDETKDGETNISDGKDGDLGDLRKTKLKKLLGRRKSSPNMLYPQTPLGSVCEEDTAACDQGTKNKLTRRRRSVAVMTTSDRLALTRTLQGNENMAASKQDSEIKVGTRRRSVAVMTTADRLALRAALHGNENMATSKQGSEMKVTRRRSSIAVMTTADRPDLKGVLQDSDKTFLAFPKEPSPPPTSRPRSSLSQQGQVRDKSSGGATEVHDSLLKIGRRMVAPMTGAQLQNRLRRYSVQYPLQTGLSLARDETNDSNEARDDDPFRGLENCRYLRRVRK